MSIIIAVSVCLVSLFQAEPLAAIFNSEHNAVVLCLFLLSACFNMKGVWLSFPVTEFIASIAVLIFNRYNRTTNVSE